MASITQSQVLSCANILARASSETLEVVRAQLDLKAENMQQNISASSGTETADDLVLLKRASSIVTEAVFSKDGPIMNP